MFTRIINIFSAVLLAALFIAFPYAASAHVLKVDGTIGAVLHIDPDDDPVANSPSTFYFDFKDTAGHFQPNGDCGCTIQIANSEGQTVLNQAIGTSTQSVGLISGVSLSSHLITFSYTFPVGDVYTVIMSGQPGNGQNFSSFKLSYDIRAERGIGNQANSVGTSTLERWNEKLGGHLLHFVIFGPAIIIAIVLVTYDRIKNRKRPKAINQENNHEPQK